MPWAAIGSLVAGTWLFPLSVKIAGPDTPAAFLGIFCLAAIPVLWLGARGGKLSFPRAHRIGAYVSVGCLAAAVLLRQAIGLVSIATLILLLILAEFKKRAAKPPSRLAFLGALLILGILTQTTSLLLRVRNLCVDLPPARLIASHGVAHMLYQGLGTEPNPWGIVSAEDASGAEAIQKINPAAGYGTPQYYREIGKLYVKLLATNPGTVFRIYVRKGLKTLELPLSIFGIPYCWPLALIVFFWVEVWRREGFRSIHGRTAAAFGGFLALFLSQGIFIFPEIRFLYPAKFAVLVLFSLTADFILARLWIAG